MNWLEKHINLFFNINAVLFMYAALYAIWLIFSSSGFPNSSPSLWTSHQWQMFNFFWRTVLIDCIIYIFLSIMCFMKKYFIFPVIVLFMGSFINNFIVNITEILKYGFIYPINNIMGIIEMLQFIFAIIGTIFWIRKIRGKNMLVNG